MSHKPHLADFRAIASRIVLLNKLVVYGGRGSRRLDVDCSTGRRPMERADEPPSTNPPLPGWVWVHIKGGGVASAD